MKRNVFLIGIGICLVAGMIIAGLFFGKDDKKEGPAFRGDARTSREKTESDKKVSKPEISDTMDTADSENAIPGTLSIIDGKTAALQFEIRIQSGTDPAYLLSNGNQKTENREWTASNSEITGTMYVKTFKTGGDVLTAACRFSDFRYLLNGTPRDFSGFMNEPFLFQIDAVGTIQDFEFVRGMPEEAGTLIRKIILGMIVTFPGGNENSWTVVERDETGAYRARYAVIEKNETRGTAVLSRVIHRYENRNEANVFQDSIDAGSTVRVLESQSRIFLSREAFWFSRIERVEKRAFSHNGYDWKVLKERFSIQNLDIPEGVRFPENLQAVKDALSTPERPGQVSYQPIPVFSGLLKTGGIDEALEMFLEAEKNRTNPSGWTTGKRFFLDFLKRNPNAVFDLVDIIGRDSDEERFDQDIRRELFRIIAEAGNEEAQKALVDAVLNPEYPVATRAGVLEFLQEIESPRPFVADRLWEFFDGFTNPSGLAEMEMKISVLYALGNIGSRMEGNDRKESGRQLLNHLNTSVDFMEQAVTLAALSKYAGPEIIDSIEPFFRSENEIVRREAYKALKGIDTPRAGETVIEHYRTEDDPDVKRTALRVLSEMPVSETTVDWARKEILVTEDVEGRDILIDILGKSINDYPGNESVLKNLSNQDLPEKTLQKIEGYLREQI